MIEGVFGPAGRTVVVEEALRGPEASVIALCDGATCVALPAARDHKRIGDGDTGPNTGGMGAFSPLPDLPDADAEAIVEGVFRHLAEFTSCAAAADDRTLVVVKRLLI